MKFKRLLSLILLINLIIVPDINKATDNEDTSVIIESRTDIESNAIADNSSNSSDIIIEKSESEDLEENTSDENNIIDSEDIEILSESAVLIDSKTGSVLYSKNSNQKMYPASTTKIMTGILAIERANLSDKTTASYKAISLVPPGHSSAYLSEGEEMTIQQLLEVLLVHSANDAANVLAEYVSGSIEDFVNLMNEKVKEIGCTNTHFVNTNGIHDENHYTTAYDMAKIMQYCMKNSTFREIVSMKTCTIPATNKSKERKYVNTNDLINPSSNYYLEECIGGKTGYTSQAGNCLVSCCNKDNLELICVVLNASILSNGSSSRYLDSSSLYKYGYSNYALKPIAHKGDVIDTIKVKKASSKTKSLDLILENDVYSLVNITKDETSSCAIVYINEDLSAPIAKDTIVGSVTYTIGSIDYTGNLVASHDVEKSDFLLFVLRFALILIIFVLLIILLNKLKRKNSKRYLRRH